MRFWTKFEDDLKLLNSVPFINKNPSKSCLQLNLIILTDFPSFTVNEHKLQNESIFKISAKVYVSDLGQNLKMMKTFNSVPFIIKTIVNLIYN